MTLILLIINVMITLLLLKIMHPVPYPLAVREKAMACGRPPPKKKGGARPDGRDAQYPSGPSWVRHLPIELVRFRTGSANRSCIRSVFMT